MGGENNRPLLLGSLYHIPDMPAVDRVHPGGRLVEIDDSRVSNQRHSHTKPTPHPAREIPSELIRGKSEFDLLHAFVDLLLDSGDSLESPLAKSSHNSSQRDCLVSCRVCPVLRSIVERRGAASDRKYNPNTVHTMISLRALAVMFKMRNNNISSKAFAEIVTSYAPRRVAEKAQSRIVALDSKGGDRYCFDDLLALSRDFDDTASGRG